MDYSSIIAALVRTMVSYLILSLLFLYWLYSVHVYLETLGLTSEFPPSLAFAYYYP